MCALCLGDWTGRLCLIGLGGRAGSRVCDLLSTYQGPGIARCWDSTVNTATSLFSWVSGRVGARSVYDVITGIHARKKNKAGEGALDEVLF